MLGSFCRKLFPILNLKTCVGYSNTHLGFVHSNHVKSLYFVGKFLSTSAHEEKQSFTVSYLMNSCGLSLENAISASKKVQLETTKRPNSVLNLLKNHGFTTIHVSKLIMKQPLLLLASPKNSLLPKIEFFKSIGVPGTDIARILSSDPKLFRRSLENQIIPCYNYVKNLVETNEKVVMAFRRSSGVFRENVKKNVGPNMAVLRELGVPQSSITLLVSQFPNAAFLPHKRFVKVVEELEGMGFNPKKSVFVQGIKVMSVIGKENLEEKFKFFSKWGWSKDEALLAFKCIPHCMGLSENRIARGMDFLVNKMGWPSKAIARRSVVLCFSVEKRLIPRCSVVQVLLSRGLVKKDLSIYTVMQPKDKDFLKRYVIKYQEIVPKLMDLYEGKIALLDLGVGSVEILRNEALVT